jgi:hypothetical protein
MAETKIKKVVSRKVSTQKSVDKSDLLLEWVKAYIEVQSCRGGADFERKQKAQAVLSKVQEKIKQL